MVCLDVDLTTSARDTNYKSIPARVLYSIIIWRLQICRTYNHKLLKNMKTKKRTLFYRVLFYFAEIIFYETILFNLFY